jgi:hypothetical protein
MISYYLIENNLTSNPDDYSAVVQTISTLTIEDLVDRMISRGSTVTKAEALSVLEELGLAVTDSLKSGYSIVTPIFNITLSISGVFDGIDDGFDSSRHSVNVRMNPGLRLKSLGPVKVEKVSAVKPMPVLQVFKDITTGGNEKLTPGGVAQINGTNLKFDEKDEKQGIFIIAANGTATKVTMLVKVKPSEVIFVIPGGLAPGTYALSVRSAIAKSKDIREGFYADDLVV